MREAGDDLQSAQPESDDVVLAAGRKIGRFEVVSVLGQCGFGITYRARDLQLARDVAIKEYLPAALATRVDGTTVRPRSTATAEDFLWGRERFVEEGRIIATLHDAPGIVRVFDFLETNGTVYIVMELVRGETLHARLQRGGPLDAVAMQRILEPLLSGLEQVHAAGFLHRDIKPANILLDEKGNPRLIDFGASRAAVANRTASMTAIFTPGYGAAEQFTSARQGPWTDIYGVAATIYHAISGKPPPNAIDRMLDDKCEPLLCLAPAGFARELLAGVDAGLAVRSAERPQSIPAWRSMMSGARPEAPNVVVPQPRRSSRLWWIGGAVAGALLLAGASYLASGPAASPPPGGTAGLAERQRIEKEVQRARDALAAAELAVQRLADQEARQAEARRTSASEGTDRNPSDIEARRKAEEEAAESVRVQQEVAKAREALAAAEVARLEAAAETARLQAAAEARQRASDEAAKRKEDAEEATKKKAEAEVAAKQKVEQEAQNKAATEVAARQKTEEEQRTAAEAAETALRLSTVDRQRVQVALTALGFDTRGLDGVFGRRSREMIASWQRRQNQPATGFLVAAQQQMLLREAAPAVAKYDEDQKKIDEAKRKAEEEAKAQPPPTSSAVSPTTRPAPAGRDGRWYASMECRQSGKHSGQGDLLNGRGSLVVGSFVIGVVVSGNSARLDIRAQPPFQASASMSGEIGDLGVQVQGFLDRPGASADDCRVHLVGP